MRARGGRGYVRGGMEVGDEGLFSRPTARPGRECHTARGPRLDPFWFS
jgi:hypothetical protein